jgi:hypothetical protein
MSEAPERWMSIFHSQENSELSAPTRPIRPELLAAKMEKIENFEQPRLLEEFGANPRLMRALWFLQWVSQPSNYPGGLTKFSSDLIAASLDRIGTLLIMKLASRDRYAPREAARVLRDLPNAIREDLLGDNTWLFEETYIHGSRRNDPSDWDAWLVKEITPSRVRAACVAAAERDLAEYFKRLCELPHVGFLPCNRIDSQHGAPWYFVKIAEAFLAFIDARAQQLRSRVAVTAVTKEIRRWIDKSRRMPKAVLFIGNSRFGKTEAVKLEVSANPGSCRLVNTPASNAISDLLREVAKSLGLEVGPNNAGRELRERIDYVLRFSHLQLIFDESQFLLPASYSRNTAPARLNWVRRSIMDQDISTVFVCTPQSYLPAKRRFVKTTGFAMEQFDERIIIRTLPEELGEDDLLAVARIHFPELAADYLRYVVDKVLATERNFVSDIEKIATLAKDNAREQGRNLLTLADIEAAMEDVLPIMERYRSETSRKTKSETPIQRVCKRAADGVQTRRTKVEHFPKISRETQTAALST